MPRRLFLLPLLAAVAFAACEAEEPALEDLDTTEDQVAYIIGYDLGNALFQQMDQLDPEDVELDEDVLVAAVRAGIRDDSMRFTRAEVDSIMQTFQDSITARQSTRNLRRSEELLADFRAREGVQATESGVLYRVVEPGTGPSPSPGDTVLVEYEGMLPDSTVFDTTDRPDRPGPARFIVGQLIPGWNEALLLMEEGAAWELVIPPDLAYGANPDPRSPIGPNQALIFDVRLVEVSPGAGQ